ncbi:MAG: hypothetical protein JSS57_04410 [Proteobacteria bacterium]|nr:hypothetical protein [Pseudomonadota bacterium]
MDVRRSYLDMIRAFPGGWDAMAAALGMTRAALENRIYERKGQSVHVETALQMQQFSGRAAFAEAVAANAGGVFLPLPDAGEVESVELLAMFNTLYAELGDLSAKFRDAVADDEINARERADLMDMGQHIHRTVEQLLSLSFRVYCRPGVDRG